jgi:hypothetical protein
MSYENEYLLVGSEALSREFNDLAESYSDFHKEVYGFRPRGMALCACHYADEASLRDAHLALISLDCQLAAESHHVFAQQKADRKKAIDDFEAYVLTCLQVGATDRTDAIAWICDSYGVANEDGQQGWEHLEYLCDIPFGYVRKSLTVTA